MTDTHHLARNVSTGARGRQVPLEVRLQSVGSQKRVADPCATVRHEIGELPVEVLVGVQLAASLQEIIKTNITEPFSQQS